MENKNIKEKSWVMEILKGVGIALIITVVLLLIFSLIITYTNIPENIIDTTTIIISAISILMASMIITSKLKKNGLINGAFIGGIYIMILYIISSFLNWEFSIDFKSLIMVITCILLGILGGILGVNRKI